MKITAKSAAGASKVAIDVEDSWSYTDIAPSPVFGSNTGGTGGLNINTRRGTNSHYLPSTVFTYTENGLTNDGKVVSSTESNDFISLSLDTSFSPLDVERTSYTVAPRGTVVDRKMNSYASYIAADGSGVWVSQGAGAIGIPTGGTDPALTGMIDRYDRWGNFQYRFDGSNGTGQRVVAIGVYGAWPHAIDGGGSPGINKLYVLTADNYVNIFTYVGPTTAPAYSTRFGGTGTSTTTGVLSNAMDVTVDASGNVYVADYGNNRIKKYTGTGTYTAAYGTTGLSGGAFSSSLVSVAVDSSGFIYALENGSRNARIQKFTSAGVYNSKVGIKAQSINANYEISPTLFYAPQRIVFSGAENAIYVADGGGSSFPAAIKQFSLNLIGAYPVSIILEGTAAPEVAVAASPPPTGTGAKPAHSNLYALHGWQDTNRRDVRLQKFYTNPPTVANVLESYVRLTDADITIRSSADGSVPGSTIDFQTVAYGIPCWTGNVWQMIREFCATRKISFRARNNTLDFYASSFTALNTNLQLDITNAASFSSRYSRTPSASQVSSTILNADWASYHSMLTPLWSAADSGTVMSVGTNAMQTVRVGDGRVFPVNLLQPIASSADGVGTYRVTDANGKAVPPTVWNAAGGRVWVSVSDQAGYIDVTLIGPNETLTQNEVYKSPYSLAIGPSDGRLGRLSIMGQGVVTNPADISVGTGISARDAKGDVTNVVSPFFGTPALTYSALGWVASRLGRGQRTLSMTLGPNTRYTSSEFGWGTMTNKRIRYRDGYYVVSAATYSSGGTVQIVAEMYTEARTVSDRWNSQLASARSAVWGQRIAEDVSASPLM